MQHLKSTIHKENLKKLKSGSKQQTIAQSLACSSVTDEQEFYFDLCNSMVSSNIPLTKLNNNVFKSFLQKYTGRHVPAESTLRKSYVDLVYKNVIEEIKKIIANNYIWFCVDETTDSCGRYIAHLMIGGLDENCASKAFLISSKQLEQTNNNTVTRFINEGLTNFFLPNPVPNKKILLMLSDAAAYMVKTYSNLKIFYENLTHCTCLAHGLNRVAETIRMQFPLVNTLISAGKKIFLKAPLRVQIFRENMPNVPLPPEPILTRWGTWLAAACYYADHFDYFKEIVLEFSPSTSEAVTKCQKVLKNETVKKNLAFIKTNYSFIVEAIKKLESRDLPLVESVEIIENFEKEVAKVRGPFGNAVSKKMNEVLTKNKGFMILKKISKVIKGDILENLTIDVPINIIPKFKNAPITSVEVERSFSFFKNVLTDRRMGFSVENLEKHLIISSFRNDSA
jgi:hypothetical protein